MILLTDNKEKTTTDNNWPMSGWLKINPACYPLPHINLEKQGLPNPNVTSASLGTNCCLAFSAALIQELVVFWALSSALLSVFMFLVLCTVFSEWCTLMLLTCSQTFKWLLNGLQTVSKLSLRCCSGRCLDFWCVSFLLRNITIALKLKIRARYAEKMEISGEKNYLSAEN